MAEPRVWLTAGLGYGDEGKGTIVDYLVWREGAHLVVRYNGGAQAGHCVVLPDGRVHIFSQFGSGTFHAGVRTHLSRFMYVEPFGMIREFEYLKELGAGDAFLRTTIDRDAPVITPFHIAANRILELSRGEKRHGSCGLGMGETVEDVRELGSDALYAGDLVDRIVIRRKLLRICDRKRAKVRKLLKITPPSVELNQNRYVLESSDTFARCIGRYAEFMKHAHLVDGGHLKVLLSAGPAVFEGAQGMLLDRRYGFYPHVTKTDITFANAKTLLAECGFDGETRKIGVLRAYFTRHGAGPFVTEDDELTKKLPDEANRHHAWQGSFRVGHFDAVAARYAIEAIGGVDEIMLTNLDRIVGLPMRVCYAYAMLPGNEIFSMESSNGVARRIRVDPDNTDAHRSLLTECLKQATPEYVERGVIKDGRDMAEYAREIAEIFVGIRCSVFSFGPTIKDKVTL